MNRLSRRERLTLILILLVGAFFRWREIGVAPNGFYHDEAYYALDALDILRGKFALFFAANNGREALFIYWLAPFIAAFGRTVFAARLASSFIGVLTLPAIYFCARELFSKRVAILAAAVLSINFWHVALSRVTFRAITLPLVLCMAIGLCMFAFRARRDRARSHRLQVFAGAATALVFYTYTSAQMFAPFLLVASGILWLTRSSQTTKVDARFFVIGFAAVLTPLLLWITRHPDMIFARAGQVSILNEAINHGDLLGTALSNIGKAAGMFVVQGDRIWRHNLSNRPVFEGLLAFVFLIGVGVILLRCWHWLRTRQDQHASFVLLVAWLIIFLVPTILAEDAPHYLRAIGALPAACVVAAIGLERSMAWISRRGVFMLPRFITQRLGSAPAILATIVLLVSGVIVQRDYFVSYANSALTGYWLEAENVALARVIQQARSPIWLDKRLADNNPTLQFLSPEFERGDVHVFDPSNGVPTVTSATLIIDPNAAWQPILNARLPLTQIELQHGILAQADNDLKPHCAFVTIAWQPVIEIAAHPIARLENGMELQSAEIDTQARESAQDCQPLRSTLALTMTWRVNRAESRDIATFAHVLRNGSLVAQLDSDLGQGRLPMSVFRVGDVIVEHWRLMVPDEFQLDPATDRVVVGQYLRGTNSRLRILDSNQNAETDSIMIFPK
jgi:4-amino-4-deoxy-L-arabinose transferase-like glycosyltransferase